MRQQSKRFWRIAAAIVAVAVTAVGCGGRQEAGRTDEKVPVETVEVHSGRVSPTGVYSGTVMPWRKVLLGAQIQGRVEKLHVDVGDRVAKDELLAELASEQLTEAQARFEALQADYDRMRALVEKGAVTQQAFDQMQATYEGAKAGYELVLASAQLRAPFAGVVSERFLDEGEVYTLMSMTTPTPAVLEIVRMDSVKVGIEIAEREKRHVVPGLAATVTSKALRGRVFRGVVMRVDPGLDQMSRTASAEIALANPGEVLRPGMFADVEVGLASREALLVPRDALVRQEGTAVFYVYAVEDGVARRRELSLGESFGSSVEVLDGLSEGEVIVTAGRYRLHDGSEVEVVAPESSGAGAGEDGR